MKKDNWRKQFDEVCYFLKGRPAEKIVKKFIADIVSWERMKAKNEVIKEINKQLEEKSAKKKPKTNNRK